MLYWRAKERIDGPLGKGGDNWRAAQMPDLTGTIRPVVKQSKEQAAANVKAAMAAFAKKPKKKQKKPKEPDGVTSAALPF